MDPNADLLALSLFFLMGFGERSSVSMFPVDHKSVLMF